MSATRPAQPPVFAGAADTAGGGGSADVVAIARSLARLGIREAGRDRGLWVDVFTAGHPEPWCADFVSWVWMTAGHPFRGGLAGWRLPSAPGMQAWFVARGRFAVRRAAIPEPGDVVSFVHQHVGIVVAASATELETVEGNSSDAVVVRRYQGWRENADIAGFGVPETARSRE